MKGPEFSIIIPTKNEAENLERLFESLKTQDLQPTEVIVADDSTDRTREVAQKYGAKVIQGVSNGLIGVARNRAAKVATTDTLVFLDADIFLPPKFLRKLVFRFLADDLSVASCYLTASRKRIKNTVYFESWNVIKRFGSITKKILAESGTCMIVKRDIFLEVNGFSEIKRLGEEVDLVQKVLKKGGKYKIIPVRIHASDRRFNMSPPKLAIQLVGMAGVATIGIIGWKIFERSRHRFEKMYGETGGKANVEKKRKKFLGIF